MLTYIWTMKADYRSSCHDNIIDLQDHSDTFSSQGKRTQRYERWLNNIIIKHVHDLVTLDI